MGNAKTRVVQFRRRREGKTNYKKRLNLLKSGLARLVVRKSRKGITSQIVQYSPEGDKVVVTVNSKSLEKLGWPARGNIPSAYLTGLLLGKKALENKVIKAILDSGMYPPIKGSRIYAVLKGAVDAGLDVPHSDDILPSDEITACKAIQDYAKKLKSENADAYQRQFSKYLKDNVDPSTLGKTFDTIKKKITGA